MQMRLENINDKKLVGKSKNRNEFSYTFYTFTIHLRYMFQLILNYKTQEVLICTRR